MALARNAQLFLILGAVSGFLAVAIGAFAAHLLNKRLPADLFSVFEVGVRYHMYHALILVGVGLLHLRVDSRMLSASGWLFVAGTLLFSGSLYTLALTGIRALGAITPLGGLSFLGGWLLLAWTAWRELGTGT